MSGDTANPRVWVNAQVFTAPLGTTAPVDVAAAWAAGWDDLGLLSEDGITQARSDTLTDQYAYGGILVRTTRSKHKRTIKVIALEDNPTVFGLVNPGSSKVTAAGITTRTIVVPQPNKVAYGLELHDGDIVKRMVIPTGEILTIADVLDTDAEMEKKELEITVYPDGTGVLFYEITNDPQAI